MFKLIIECETEQEIIDYLKGPEYKLKIDEIWNHVFRPAWKHGYNKEEINQLLQNECCDKLIDELAEIYKEVINE